MVRRRGSRNWRRELSQLLEPIVKVEVLSPEDQAKLDRSTSEQDDEPVSSEDDVLDVDREERHLAVLKSRLSLRSASDDPSIPEIADAHERMERRAAKRQKALSTVGSDIDAEADEAEADDVSGVEITF